MFKGLLLSSLLPCSSLRRFFFKKELNQIDSLTNYITDAVLYFDNYLITPTQARSIALKYYPNRKNLKSVIRGSVR